MEIYRTKGIILKRTNLGEADRILTLFTESEGKMKALAKGIRRVLSKNAGHLELFNYSDLQIVKTKSELEKITNASTLESFKNLREDLRKTALAYFFSELIDKLTSEKEKNERIFRLLLETLRYLDKMKDLRKENLLTFYFQLNLLSFLGFRPEINLCLRCRKKIKAPFYYFSSQLGGILCPSCFKYPPKGLKISQKAIKTLRRLSSYDMEIVERLRIDCQVEKEIRALLEDFFKYIAEKEFETPKFLKEIHA